MRGTRHSTALLCLLPLLFNAAHAWTAWRVTMLQGDGASAHSVTATEPAFDAAINAAYGGQLNEVMPTTIAQYSKMFAWLGKLEENVTSQAPELLLEPVRAIINASGQLAWAHQPRSRKPRLNEAGILTELAQVNAQLALLPPGQGYPLTRRVFIGALLKLRHERGRFSGEAQGIVDAALMRLFDLHRTSVEAKRLVQFVHVSKSGGTNLCMAAGANGCATEGFDAALNCLIRDFNDQPRWASAAGHNALKAALPKGEGRESLGGAWFVNLGNPRAEKSCEERAGHLQARGWNFFANEYASVHSSRPVNMLAAAGVGSAAAPGQEGGSTPTQSSGPVTTASGVRGGSSSSSAAAPGQEGGSAAVHSSGPVTTASGPSTTAGAGGGSSAVPVDEGGTAGTAGGAADEGAQVCAQFVNLIMFRNPISRMASHLAWIQAKYLEMVNDTDAVASAFASLSDSRFWELMLPAGANNYYVRSLLGPRYMGLPLAVVRSRHAQQAKLAVLQHDLLLMLEQPQRNEAVLRVGLGWGVSIHDDKIRSSVGVRDKVTMPPDFDRLVRANLYDVDVHALAEQLQALDVVLFEFAQRAGRGPQGQPEQGGSPLQAPEARTGGGGGTCGYVGLPLEAPPGPWWWPG